MLKVCERIYSIKYKIGITRPSLPLCCTMFINSVIIFINDSPPPNRDGMFNFLHILFPPTHASESFMLHLYFIIFKSYFMPNLNSFTSIHPLNWNLFFFFWKTLQILHLPQRQNPPSLSVELTWTSSSSFSLSSTLQIPLRTSWADERLRRWHGHSQ